MAVVVGAGPSPANEQAADVGRSPPFEIRKIEIADVIECIAKGLQDFGRAPDTACSSAPSMRSAAS